MFSFTDANTTTTAPHHHRQPHRVVCYTAGWASYRPDPVQFHPEDVNTQYCSHLIFAFAKLDDTGLNLMSYDGNHDIEM